MSAVSNATVVQNSSALNVSIQKGIAAGLVGGSIFGVQMAVGGMLPMIASMVGSESVVIGFILHLIISAFIGATFGVIATRVPGSDLVQLAAGAIYGIIWWVLGALIIMPLVLGMGEMVLVVGEMQLMSLIGHVIFGIVMGGFFSLASRN